MDDWELVHRYARDGSEDAFNELLRRHMHLIYSTARRRLGGDSHLAEDVTQRTFCLLADRAHSLPRKGALVGWLYTTACNVARETLRAEKRRKAREDVVSRMDSTSPEHPKFESDSSWESLAPCLDDAMAALGERDRVAILLRYFQRQSMRDVAAVLGVSEAAAKMRIGRALGRLRLILRGHGVAISSGALAEAIGTNAMPGTPPGLVASVGAAVARHAGEKVVSTSLITKAFQFMAQLQIRTVLTGAALLFGVTAVIHFARYKSDLGSSHEPLATAGSVVSPVPESALQDSTSALWRRAADSGSARDGIGGIPQATDRLRSAITDPWPGRKAPVARVDEALALFGANRRAAAPILIEFLDRSGMSGELGARYLAAHGLVALGPDAASVVPDFIRILKEGKLATLNDMVPKLFAAAAPDSTVVADLMGVFSMPNIPGRGQVGAAIIEVLRRHPGTEAGYQPFLSALLRQGDRETRQEAALVFARWPGGMDPDAIPILVDALALDRLRDPSAYDPVFIPAQSTTVLQDGVREDDDMWRRRVVWTLSEAGTRASAAAGAIEEMISLLPRGSELRQEALVALGKMDPERRASTSEVEVAMNGRERGEYLVARARSGDVTLSEVIEGLGHRQSVEACAELLPSFGPDAQQARDALNQAIDRFESYEAAQCLKLVAPELLVERLEQRQLKGLWEVAQALGELGPRASMALPHLEAISAELALDDRGNLHAVTAAIEAIDPLHRKALYTHDDLSEATTALLQAIHSASKGEGSVYHAYLTGFQDLNNISRARLMKFVEATRADPFLHQIFVTKLLEKNPALAADLGADRVVAK